MDVCLHHVGKFNLRLFCSLLQSLKGHSIFSQINSLILFELIRQIVDDSLVKVIPSKMGIPIGRFDLEDTFPQLEDGDIKSPPPQIEDCNLFILLFFETIGEGSGGWFIDDSNDIQTCYSPCILRGLTLPIIKIR